MKYELFYQHKVWRKDQIQKIEVFKLHTASTEFARLMRLPGVLYVRMFEDKKLVAEYRKEGLKNE